MGDLRICFMKSPVYNHNQRMTNVCSHALYTTAGQSNNFPRAFCVGPSRSSVQFVYTYIMEAVFVIFPPSLHRCRRLFRHEDSARGLVGRKERTRKLGGNRGKGQPPWGMQPHFVSRPSETGSCPHVRENANPSCLLSLST